MSKLVSRLKDWMVQSLHRVDGWLTPIRILGVAIYIVIASMLVATVITIVNLKYYLGSYVFCLRVDCVSGAVTAFQVQLDMIGAGGKVAAFVALILGPYVALKGYLSTASAEAFGNNIAHLGFFERFIRSEIDKRDRMALDAIDIYSLYRLMFPNADGRAIHASKKFLTKMGAVRSALEASNRDFESHEGHFDFNLHRTKFRSSIASLYITQLNAPRIDFLETEDQVLDFLEMLTRVFCSESQNEIFPKRLYR